MDEAVIAGVGLRRGCGAAELVALVRRAAAVAGRAPTVLAAPAFKAEQAALGEAAAALGLPLLWVEAAALRRVQGRCPTLSAAAAAAVGVASVAEGAALAAAGEGGRLLLPRITSGAATCALAVAK